MPCSYALYYSRSVSGPPVYCKSGVSQLQSIGAVAAIARRLPPPERSAPSASVRTFHSARVLNYPAHRVDEAAPLGYVTAMDLRELTPAYSVAPQIDPEDLPAIAALGYTTVICNRPDAENPPSHQAEAMRAACEAAGMAFIEIPVTHQGLNAKMVESHRAAVAGCSGKALAYCASGTRSTIVWALGQAGTMEADAIVAAARKGGYQIDHLRPHLEG